MRSIHSRRGPGTRPLPKPPTDGAEIQRRIDSLRRLVYRKAERYVGMTTDPESRKQDWTRELAEDGFALTEWQILEQGVRGQKKAQDSERRYAKALAARQASGGRPPHNSNLRWTIYTFKAEPL